MIRFKESVRIHPDTLRMPEMWRILQVVHAAAPPGYDVTVTSACDSTHKEGSKHYLGKAWDFRVRDYPTKESPQTWLRRIINGLGNGFFSQLEGDHLHCQWNG